MKALSLIQPWATLVAKGVKRYETRSWRTHYRGPLAIHASATVRGVDYDSFVRLNGYRVIRKALPFWDCLIRGAVLCIVDLKDCQRTEYVREKLGDIEFDCGNYSDGRFAWECEVTEVFVKPFAAKGNRGLWEWVR